jgi:hypothetical protein
MAIMALLNTDVNRSYLFDVFLGTDYNRSPPRVKYMTVYFLEFASIRYLTH